MSPEFYYYVPTLLTVFGIVSAIMLILMPLFVYNIRNRVIDMNRKMSTIIELLGGEASPYPKIKHCPSCQARNRISDYTCIDCGAAI